MLVVHLLLLYDNCFRLDTFHHYRHQFALLHIHIIYIEGRTREQQTECQQAIQSPAQHTGMFGLQLNLGILLRDVECHLLGFLYLDTIGVGIVCLNLNLLITVFQCFLIIAQTLIVVGIDFGQFSFRKRYLRLTGDCFEFFEPLVRLCVSTLLIEDSGLYKVGVLPFSRL